MNFKLAQYFRQGKANKVVVILIVLGLVVTITGLTLSVIYRFHGHFRLTQGESALEANKSYGELKTGFIRPNPEYQWAIQLEEVSLRYSATGDIAEMVAGLFFYDQTQNKGYQGVAGPNHPLPVDKLHVRPVGVGVAPALDLRDQEGQLIWRGAPKLDILDKDGQRTDIFSAGGSEYSIAFYPAARYLRGQWVNTSLTPTNPLFMVSQGADAKPIAVGGEPVQVGTYTLEIPAYRYWLEFEVRSSAGETLLYVGPAILLLGLVLSLIVSRRRMLRGLAG